MASIWSELTQKGVDRTKVEPGIKKLLGPPATIAKPQFREAFLREITTATGRPVTHEETIEYFLMADRMWETWPNS
jgi:hypothetical protein